MSIDGNTLVGDLPQPVMNALKDELEDASKDNPFTAYMIAKELKLEDAYQCFPFNFPEDMSLEMKKASAQTITNFFNTDVKNAQEVPPISFGLSMMFMTADSKEHAQALFIMVVRTMRIRFPDWNPTSAKEDDEEKNKEPEEEGSSK